MGIPKIGIYIPICGDTNRIIPRNNDKAFPIYDEEGFVILIKYLSNSY